MRSVGKGASRKRAPWVVLAVLSLLLFSMVLNAAYLRNFPITVKQPDGVELQLFATGDEFYHWVHDENGFTIVQNPNTGYAEYAILQNGELVPSGHIVGMVDPASVGLEPNLNISPEQMEQIRLSYPEPAPSEPPLYPAPTTGIINNICIFIRFAGEAEFTDATSTYTTMFNNVTPGTNSMLNYFQEVSYNALTVSSAFYPIPGATVVSYQDAQTRGYYQPYHAATNPIGYTGGDSGTDRRYREHTLLMNATNAVSGAIPGGLNVDGDNDGYVDNVCYVVYGAPDAWGNLLWPHMWVLWTGPVYGDPIDCRTYINGKQVWDYNFQLQTSLLPSNVGVLCHEMFHSMGAPDLYHYTPDGIQPAYKWDIMEWDLNPPQHMTAYMKRRYGTWIGSIPQISDAGTYTLNPLTSSTNNCYKIASNSGTEYFVVEYRREASSIFENSLPGTGMLVYRINTTEDGNGNASGPPDELYIYRPDGTLAANGNPTNANFSSNVGRTAINDGTNPSSFLSTGAAGGLDIWDIGAVNGTISFKLGHAPEIDVQRPVGTSIADGGSDNVGSKPAGAAATIDYTIENTGTTQLTVTGATASNYVNCGGFTVNMAMPLNVAAGGSGTLSISITPTAVGAFSFDMDIASNDSNEAPYDIAIQGTGSTGGSAAVFRVTRGGHVGAEGSYYGAGFYTGSADVAEWVPVSEEVEPGDVLELDPDNPGHYRKARSRCSTLVGGVVSTDPGVILGSSSPVLDIGHWTLDSALLALLGIVPVKVTDEGGPIQPGDLLVSSSIPGYAMRWDPQDGEACGLVGKALEPFDSGAGMIQMLLMR